MTTGTVSTKVPARLDRLPWSRWHWMIVIGCWCVVLFFASAGASAAYLTVSEIFPMETRAMAIAFFDAIGTAAGGIAGPLIFASLVETGVPGNIALAFSIGALVMIFGGIVELFLGVKAERKGLEEVATPLSAATPQAA
jgi:MFS family permease